MARRIVLLAGEESGDGHGARLVTALQWLAPGVEVHGMGGARMQAAGLRVIRNLDGMQIMGFWEVVKNLGLVRRVFGEVEQAIRTLNPDLVCGIDYPGFNLRMERRCKALGFKTAHYIAPQVWAWKRGRAKQMARYLDQLITIFDFEPPFFTPHGLKTDFVGHPLIEGYDRNALWQLSNRLAQNLNLPGAQWSSPDSVVGETRAVRPIVLLPGSREQVLEHHLARFVEAAEGARRAQQATPEAMPILVVRPPSAAGLPIWQRVAGRVMYVDGQLPATAFLGQAVLSSSGTACLEAGLTATPMAVAYVGGRVSAALAHLILDIPVISLVNIVLEGYLIKEFIQGEAHPAGLAAELTRLCSDVPYRERLHKGLLKLAPRLGWTLAAGETPSIRAARLLLQTAGIPEGVGAPDGVLAAAGGLNL